MSEDNFCPKGKINCKRYECDMSPTCNISIDKYGIDITDFEVCPWPSKQQPIEPEKSCVDCKFYGGFLTCLADVCYKKERWQPKEQPKGCQWPKEMVDTIALASRTQSEPVQNPVDVKQPKAEPVKWPSFSKGYHTNYSNVVAPISFINKWGEVVILNKCYSLAEFWANFEEWDGR